MYKGAHVVDRMKFDHKSLQTAAVQVCTILAIELVRRCGRFPGSNCTLSAKMGRELKVFLRGLKGLGAGGYDPASESQAFEFQLGVVIVYQLA